MSKVDCFLMFKNNPAWTLKCIEYFKKYTDPKLCRLVLVNNGSDERIVKAIKDKIKNIEILDLNVSVGVAYAWNYAIQKKCESEYFVLLHNDVLVTEGWLEKLLSVFENEDELTKFSCVYPRTAYAVEYSAWKFDLEINKKFLENKTNNKSYINNSIIENVLSETYKDYDGLKNYAKKIEDDNLNSFNIVDEVSIFCTLFKRSNIEEPLFDEDFIYPGGEGKMFHLKHSKCSLFPVLKMDTFVHHNGNTTSDGIGMDYEVVSKYTQKTYEKKLKEYNDRIYQSYIASEFFMGKKTKALFVRDNGIGDIVMSLLPISFLKKMNPNIDITYCVNNGFLKFFSDFDCIDHVIPIPKKISNMKRNSQIKFLKEMYKDKFDFIFNFCNVFENTNVDSEENRSDFLVKFLQKIFYKEYGIEIKLGMSQPEFLFSKDIRFDLPERYCAIAPFGTCDIRSLPKKLFISIIEKEIEKGNNICFLDKEKYSYFPEQITNSNNFFDLSGKTNLIDIPYILKDCDYVYTSDSGTFHIASILGVPCRSFFGSIHPEMRNKYYNNENNIFYFKKDLPCAPCYDVGCEEIKCLQYSEEDVERIVNGENINYV